MKLFTRKPLRVDCYTITEGLTRVAPIVKSTKVYPDWWRALPKEVPVSSLDVGPTMRTCYGFMNFFANSYALPMWSDLNIMVGARGTTSVSWSFASDDGRAYTTPAYQRGDVWPDTQYAHVSIQTPWRISCPEDFGWVYTQAVWHMDRPDDYIVGSGTIGFKYQHTAHVNLMIPRSDTPRVVRIKAGVPIMHLTPLTERSLDLQCHQVTAEEFIKLAPSKNITFTQRYAFNKRQQNLHCPMHKGE